MTGNNPQIGHLLRFPVVLKFCKQLATSRLRRIISAHASVVVALAMLWASPAPAQTSASPPLLTYHWSTMTGPLTFDPSASAAARTMTMTGKPGDPVRIGYGPDTTVTADVVGGDWLTKKYYASGRADLRELTAHLTADSIALDGLHRTAVAEHVHLVRFPFTLFAQRLILNPAEMLALNTSITTAPPNVTPGYEIRTARLTIDPSQHLATVDNGSIYVFGRRFITVKRFHFHYGTGQSGSSALDVQPSGGYSPRYGTFVTVNAQPGSLLPVSTYLILPTAAAPQGRFRAVQTIRVGKRRRPSPVAATVEPGKPSSGPPNSTGDEDVATTAPDTSQTKTDSLLAALRQFAAGDVPLPPGDPLTFKYYVPIVNPVQPLAAHSYGGVTAAEDLTIHMATSGRNLYDLYITRAPEATVAGVLPLTHVTDPPAGQNPSAFRSYLRIPVLYAGSSATFGDYFEQPDNMRDDRLELTTWIGPSPVLIGQNTVFVPRLLGVDNLYGDARGSYRYVQASISMTQYITHSTAYGFDYYSSVEGGNSPFNFDVLNTDEELDLRGQSGYRSMVIGGLLQYDAANKRVIDYKVTLAPDLSGLIPTLTYDFRDAGIDVGIKFANLSL